LKPERDSDNRQAQDNAPKHVAEEDNESAKDEEDDVAQQRQTLFL
jgi:hypothetical protein